MRRIRRGRLLPEAVGVAVFLAALTAAFVITTPASASAVLQVTPATGLTAGQVVSVNGSGFDTSSEGGILECNNDASQPTVSVLGNDIPVSCTSPLSNLTSTDSSGNLSASFTVKTGVVGPPGTGTDSSGGSAATDAASYPCPPTQAQMNAGVSCVISFGDLGGTKASMPITFETQTSPTSTTTTTAAPATTATTVPLPGFLTVVAGQATMIQGAGFTPGESVTIDIYSTPIKLGVFVANGQGIASGFVTIPLNTVVGYHTLTMTGGTSGHVDNIPAWIIMGNVVTASSATAAPAPATSSTAAPSSGTPSTSAASLAYTGAGHGVWLTLLGGIILLDLGYLLMTTFRRPRAFARGFARSIRQTFRSD